MVQTTETEQPVKELDLPKPHLLIQLVAANETYLLGARGTFKTSRGISLYFTKQIYEMPRATGVLVGLSYEHLFENTVPPLMHALDEFGFVEGTHFVIGTAPPKSWEKPYLAAVKKKYDHNITWHNGTDIALISLAKRASANGVSAQFGVFDEAKFMKERQLMDEIFPIFRGNEKYFKNCSGYLSKFFASDKMADPVQINWLLNKRKLNNQAKIDLVINLQLHLNQIKQEYNSAGINKRQKLKVTINAVETRLAKLRSDLVFYVESSAYDILPLVGEKWLADKRRNIKDYEFAIAIENKDPDKPGQSFYPDFNTDVHTYEEENDILAKAFIIAPDYQHSVSPIPIAQLGKLPGSDKVSLNFVDEIYTMDPEGLQEAVQKFCNRYQFHPVKTVHYVYDHTAVGKRVDADAYYLLVERVLRKNGWSVRSHYTGQAPSHFTKYNNTKEWFKEQDEKVHAIRINRKRCKKMIISITASAAKTTNGKTEKDKKNEKEKGLDQSETTHFSDAFDMINHAVLALKLIKNVHQSVSIGTR